MLPGDAATRGRPRTLGHEPMGRVAALGPDAADTFSIGDRCGRVVCAVGVSSAGLLTGQGSCARAQRRRVPVHGLRRVHALHRRRPGPPVLQAGGRLRPGRRLRDAPPRAAPPLPLPDRPHPAAGAFVKAVSLLLLQPILTLVLLQLHPDPDPDPALLQSGLPARGGQRVRGPDGVLLDPQDGHRRRRQAPGPHDRRRRCGHDGAPPVQVRCLARPAAPRHNPPMRLLTCAHADAHTG